MTHKLATWFDQFGSSGCVGCGRCITWCPVGIDITEEARAIRAERRSRRCRPLSELIAAAPVFAGLEPGHLELIAGCGRNARFAAGSYLLREGEPADEFYLIRARHGRARSRRAGRGADRDRRRSATGDIVGCSWLFAPYRWHLRRAHHRARRALIGIRRRVPARQMRGRPRSRLRADARFAAGRSIERLQATRLQLLDVYGNAGCAGLMPRRATDGRRRRSRSPARARETRRHLDARARAARAAEPLEFAPGQFTMLYAFGVGEVADLDQRRPRRARTRSCTPSAPSALVTERHLRRRAGRVLGVRGPFGTGLAAREASRATIVVIVAGGLGLAPLRPAIHRLLARASATGGSILLYGGAPAGPSALRDELDGWRRRATSRSR